MPDYGLKKPAQIKVFVPMMRPHCSQCGAMLNIVQIDKVASKVIVRHPAHGVTMPTCSYGGRSFAMELDVHYLKEVTES